MVVVIGIEEYNSYNISRVYFVSSASLQAKSLPTNQQGSQPPKTVEQPSAETAKDQPEHEQHPGKR